VNIQDIINELKTEYNIVQCDLPKCDICSVYIGEYIFYSRGYGDIKICQQCLDIIKEKLSQETRP